MPELAEVDFYRKQWDCGLGEKIAAVKLHAGKRVFRGTDTDEMLRRLPGAVLVSSESSGKKMLFRFSGHIWLGLHLGMTGKLTVSGPGHEPASHDHLVLFQTGRALVFNDARQFGRAQFHQGEGAPDWWADLPPDIGSDAFTHEVMALFLAHHPKMPIKAALLLQDGFPGVGNWMADEILWRSHLPPQARVGDLSGEETKRLWRELRFVCRVAMKKVAKDFSDPPAGWLFHERWSRQGFCPVHKTPLPKATVGGRTSVWCPECQPDRKAGFPD